MGMTTGTWRVLRDGAHRGAENMAIDEAIAEAVARGTALPTLRFYRWQPPCVSLGRHQPFSAVDTAACDRLGYDIVRRPTGGRAILHTDELTYSVAAPANNPLMAGMVLDAYLRISQGLVAGLRTLGVAAEPAPGSSRAGPNASAACFEVPSAYEIVVDGKKLLGSAQHRRADLVLQHGSLPLTGDLTRLIDCLAFTSEEERAALRHSLEAHAATLSALAGREIGFDEAADALTAGFAGALGVGLVPGELSAEERAAAARLAAERYQTPEWTAQR